MTYCGESELSRRLTELTLGGVICWLLMVLGGCGSNGAKVGEVRDAARYWTCSRSAPPAERSGTSGSVRFNLVKRTLTLKPGAAGVRLALFSGSGFMAPGPEVLAYLRDTQADVFVVLGGLGRSSAQAAEATRALQSLQRLVLVVRGGADSFEIETKAPGTLVLDASALRSVRIGQDALVPWPGADQGRYALDPTHCGFGENDLVSALQELGPREPRERRWLLSWQAPEPGSALASFSVRAGMSGVLSAWPPQPEGETTSWDPARPRFVPRAWGPAAEGQEGQALPPGALVLSFDEQGPRVAR